MDGFLFGLLAIAVFTSYMGVLCVTPYVVLDCFKVKQMGLYFFLYWPVGGVLALLVTMFWHFVGVF